MTNFKFLSILFALGLITLSSCNKEEMMTDSQLINAIQKASKQDVDASHLPSSARIFLSSEFSERHNERTLIANGLGYEVRMDSGDRPDDGSDGEINDDRPDNGSYNDRPDDGCDGCDEERPVYVYFDLDGRPLGDRPDNHHEGGDEDRPDDGSGGDGDEDRPDGGS